MDLAVVLAFLFKPVIGIAMLAAMFFVPHWIAWPIKRFAPDCRLKRWLFDGWESHSRRPADPN